jgi:hypothetical protein
MRAVRRSASGKEVALVYSSQSGIVSAAAFSGDFFSYPEEGVMMLARSLIGIPEASLPTQGKVALQARAEEMDLLLIGITLDDVLSLLEAA